ncbi:ATP-dependent RecD-like DNA helicase [Vibrio breoganii]
MSTIINKGTLHRLNNITTIGGFSGTIEDTSTHPSSLQPLSFKGFSHPNVGEECIYGIDKVVDSRPIIIWLFSSKIFKQFAPQNFHYLEFLSETPGSLLQFQDLDDLRKRNPELSANLKSGDIKKIVTGRDPINERGLARANQEWAKIETNYVIFRYLGLEPADAKTQAFSTANAKLDLRRILFNDPYAFIAYGVELDSITQHCLNCCSPNATTLLGHGMIKGMIETAITSGNAGVERREVAYYLHTNNIAVENIKNIMLTTPRIHHTKTHLYSDYHYSLERENAQLLAKHLKTNTVPTVTTPIPSGTTLTDEQKEAVSLAAKSAVTVLTGNPGTGKTTITKTLIELLRSNNPSENIVCIAPTGKASSRMKEATGEEVRTLHSKLGFTFKNGFTSGKVREVDADTIILDEASMLDAFGLNKLLRSLKQSTRLVLVGDPDQLGSIEVGRVLHDLISIKEVSYAKLSKTHRFGSDIAANTTAIKEGKCPKLEENYAGGWHFIKANTDQETKEAINEIITDYAPVMLNAKPEDVQILTPQHNTSLGTRALNHLASSVFNKNASNFQLPGSSIRVGDSVILTRNDRKHTIPNGAKGQLKNINMKNKTFTVNYGADEGNKSCTYELKDSNAFEMAFATTIHKSQGSEYPIVIIPVTMAHRRMLTKDVFFTGTTRAKQHIFVVGDEKALKHAISTDNTYKRISSFHLHIKNEGLTTVQPQSISTPQL